MVVRWRAYLYFSRPRDDDKGYSLTNTLGGLLGGGPVVRDEVVLDELAVARPDEANGLGRTNASAVGVTSGAEPVVLGGTSGASTHTEVGGTVDSVTEELVLECNVVGDDGGGKVVGDALHGLEHTGDILVSVLGHNLEGSKELGGGNVEVLLGCKNRVKGNLNGGGLNSTVLLVDGVVLELLATKEKLGAREAEYLVLVLHDTLGGPAEDGANGEVVEGAASGKSLHLVNETGLVCIFVAEEHRLSRALLSRDGVRILITLPCNVLNVLLVDNIGSDDLPVKSSVLDLDLAVGGLEQLVSHGGAASELSQAYRGIGDNLLGGETISVEEIHCVSGHSALDKEADVLLKNHTCLGGTLDDGLVTHVECSHQLEEGDLQRKVERSHNGHRSVRPAVSAGLLTIVVAGD